MTKGIAMFDVVAWACPTCGAGETIRSDATETTCSVCREHCVWRRCPHCSKSLAVTARLTNSAEKFWHCNLCGVQSKRRRFTEVTVPKPRSAPRPADLGIDSPYRRLSDPGRRHVKGSIVHVEGLSGMTTGTATVVFDNEGVTLILGDVNRPFMLRYSDIQHLQVGGRGHFTTQKGGGWTVGGIGAGMTNTAKAMIEGYVLSAIANALTTRTVYHTESLIHLGWNTGSLTILNTVMPPAKWNSLLRPVFDRIDAARQQLPAISAEKACPLCAETIKAAATRCKHCRADIGGLPSPMPLPAGT